jgi:hypothetical protein
LTIWRRPHRADPGNKQIQSRYAAIGPRYGERKDEQSFHCLGPHSLAATARRNSRHMHRQYPHIEVVFVSCRGFELCAERLDVADIDEPSIATTIDIA